MFNEPFRNDPRIILENAFRGLVVLLVASLYNVELLKDIYSALKNGGLAAVRQILHSVSTSIPWIPLFLGALILIIFTCFYGFRRWWCLTFQLTDTTFYRLDNRMIRRSLELSRHNIANVEISRSLLSRLLGTATVKVNTNTRSTANSNDAKVYLAYDKALALQSELKKTLTSTVNPETTDEEPDFIFQADVSMILKHTLISISWLQIFIGGIIPLFSIYPLMFMLNAGYEDFIGGLITAILVPLSILVLPPIQTFVRYYGFEVKRYGDTLYCQYGLISNHQYTLPLKRVNAITIEENLIAQLAGMAAVSAVNIGMTDDQQQESLILPMLPKKELFQLFKEALPEYAHEMPLKSQPRKALVPIFSSITLVFILPAIIGIILIPNPWKIFAPLWLIVGILYGVYRYKTPGIATDDQFIFIASGAFDRKTTLIPLNRLQVVEYSSGPILQLVHLERALICILASSAMSKYPTGIFEPSDLQILKQALLES